MQTVVAPSDKISKLRFAFFMLSENYTKIVGGFHTFACKMRIIINAIFYNRIEVISSASNESFN